jgi:hypothetical protein
MVRRFRGDYASGAQNLERPHDLLGIPSRGFRTAWSSIRDLPDRGSKAGTITREAELQSFPAFNDSIPFGTITGSLPGEISFRFGNNFRKQRALEAGAAESIPGPCPLALRDSGEKRTLGSNRSVRRNRKRKNEMFPILGALAAWSPKQRSHSNAAIPELEQTLTWDSLPAPASHFPAPLWWRPATLPGIPRISFSPGPRAPASRPSQRAQFPVGREARAAELFDLFQALPAAKAIETGMQR